MQLHGIIIRMTSYFPRLVIKNSTLSEWFLFISPTNLHLGASDLFRMAWSKQWGAISMTTALWGTCCNASWNSTGLIRLLTWYSVDEYLARSVCQLDSGIDELIHLLLLGLGTMIWNIVCLMLLNNKSYG